MMTQVPAKIPPVLEAASVSGKETILYVEDEVSLRKLVVRVLAGAGYRILSAGTAAEALRLNGEAESPPDLLLTDVVLPGDLQGNDLARELLASRPDLPVLFVSGYSRDALFTAGRLTEGVNLLEKPFGTEALASEVRRLLDQARTVGAAAGQSTLR